MEITNVNNALNGANEAIPENLGVSIFAISHGIQQNGMDFLSSIIASDEH